MPIKDLYTAEELNTSRAYNEALRRAKYQQGLNVRLDGPDRSQMTWALGDPVASAGWGASQIAMIKTLLPHIRQFIHVRQALVRAQAGDTTVTALLDNPRIGVLHLDRRGRILAANDRARSLHRHGEELSDADGVLQARAPDDQIRLAQLVAEALPTSNRGAPSPPGGDGSTFPGAPSIHAHRTTRPAAFFLCSHSRHFLELANPGSDGKVLKALALAVLQLWPLAAGAAYRLNQLRYWGTRPSFAFVEEPETNGVVERWNRTPSVARAVQPGRSPDGQ